jgi:hypothetical protein
MAWDHRASGLSKEDSELIVSEKNGKFSVQNGSVSNGHPKWVHDVWGLVKLKH